MLVRFLWPQLSGWRVRRCVLSLATGERVGAAIGGAFGARMGVGTGTGIGAGLSISIGARVGAAIGARIARSGPAGGSPTSVGGNTSEKQERETMQA